jgi:hypothetical protein
MFESDARYRGPFNTRTFGEKKPHIGFRHEGTCSLYITKILALKQESRLGSGRFSNGRIPTKVRKATQKLRGSAILGQAKPQQKNTLRHQARCRQAIVSVASTWREKGEFRAFGAAAARADLAMSQRNQTVCYETVQPRPKMGVC